MHSVIHKFLKTSFRNINKRRVLILRLHDMFHRDALEAHFNLQTQLFTKSFLKGAIQSE